jgi:hypothetical protein
VPGFGILGGFAGFVTIAGILLLELWPRKTERRRISAAVLCLAADYAPATLLAACGGFLLSFLPQRALEYRKSSFLLVDQQRITVALWSLIRVPEYVVGVDRAVALWSTVTITLSVLAVFILPGAFTARNVRYKSCIGLPFLLIRTIGMIAALVRRAVNQLTNQFSPGTQFWHRAPFE